MLYHLGGGTEGLEHFFEQHTGTLNAVWRVLGNVEFTPERCKLINDGVHAEVGARSIRELNEEREELLLGLLRLRT